MREESSNMAPVGQIIRHGAGSQCQHLLGKEKVGRSPGKTKMRDADFGVSKTDE